MKSILILVSMYAWMGCAQAADAPVVNIITIDTQGHFDEFLAAHKRARAIYARIDNGQRRLLRDSANSDIVYVIAEFKDEAAAQAAQAARTKDPEMAALIKETANASWKTLSSKTGADITPRP